MKSLFLIFILLFPTIAFGNYPPTRPLRLLVTEAELVVVAKVLRLEKESEWGKETAILEIKKVLKGEVDRKEIKVNTNHYLVCPSPARFKPDSIVLAFLNRGDEGYFQPHGLVYGTKYLTPQELQTYEERIKEILVINALPDGDGKQVKLVDWFIECMRSPATNWEGTYELSPQKDSDRENKDRIYRLPREQKRKLRNLLLARQELVPIELELINLIKANEDPVLLAFLIRQINQSDTFNVVLSERLMHPIAEISGRGELYAIRNEYHDYDPSISGKDYNAIIKKFIGVLNYEIPYTSKDSDGEAIPMDQEGIVNGNLIKAGSSSPWSMIYAIGLSVLLLGGGVWYLRTG